MAILNKHHGSIPADAIYIGRGSKWGNPHVIGQHGNRDEVCDAYERDLQAKIRAGSIPLKDLAALHGKDLVCFCMPQRCHGESLVKAARWAYDQLQAKELPVTEPTPASRPEFKLIVAGGRDFDKYQRLVDEVTRLAENELKAFDVSIVSGMAKGADRLAYHFAKSNGIKVYEMPADWDTHGKRAGFLRNEAMAAMADGLLAFWDGQSRGTAHMIETMKALKKSTRVVRYDTPPAVKAGLFIPNETKE